MSRIADYITNRQAEWLDKLHKLVVLESPTPDKDAVDRVGVQVMKWLQQDGITAERLPNQIWGDVVVGRIPGKEHGRRIVLLCHMDTVWPVGTISGQPWRIDGNICFGPGTADMKGGIVVALSAMQALTALELKPAGDLVALFTSDEEMGSEAGRPAIEKFAAESDLVLCMEPSLPDGSLKTERKGVAQIGLTTYGRAAHSGGAHEKGINAIEEMAHHILTLQALTDYQRGTTISVGKIAGGTAVNTIPPECHIDVDVRMTKRDEYERIQTIVSNLRPVHSEARLEVEFSGGRPPMPRDFKIARAFDQAQKIGRRHGIKFDEGSSGGASDANFAAAMGIAVLDGLGAVGGGLHAMDEYIEISSLAERGTLLAHLVTEWNFD